MDRPAPGKFNRSSSDREPKALIKTIAANRPNQSNQTSTPIISLSKLKNYMQKDVRVVGSSTGTESTRPQTNATESRGASLEKRVSLEEQSKLDNPRISLDYICSREKT